MPVDLHQTRANLKATLVALHQQLVNESAEDADKILSEVEAHLQHIRDNNWEYDQRNVGETDRQAALPQPEPDDQPEVNDSDEETDSDENDESESQSDANNYVESNNDFTYTPGVTNATSNTVATHSDEDDTYSGL